jgi:hypothetical protein
MGAKPYQSQILSRRLLGSKILTGSEIPMMLWPENTLDAACDITLFTIPFYFSKIFVSTHLRPPLAWISRPSSISVFLVEMHPLNS